MHGQQNIKEIGFFFLSLRLDFVTYLQFMPCKATWIKSPMRVKLSVL